MDAMMWGIVCQVVSHEPNETSETSIQESCHLPLAEGGSLQ